MKTEQFNCRAVSVLAILVGLMWLSIELLSRGALGRAVGWEHIPLNVVIAADAVLWAACLLALQKIDNPTALGAVNMAGFMLILPHLSVSLVEMQLNKFFSPTIHDARVLEATLLTIPLVFTLSWVWDWSVKLTRRAI